MAFACPRGVMLYENNEFFSPKKAQANQPPINVFVLQGDTSHGEPGLG